VVRAEILRAAVLHHSSVHHKPIPAPPDRLDEFRFVGVVAQGLAEVADGGRDGRFAEGDAAPDLVAEEVRGDDAVAVLDEAHEKVEDPAADVDMVAIACEREEIEIEFEIRESVDSQAAGPHRRWAAAAGRPGFLLGLFSQLMGARTIKISSGNR
jgi:hypothetical protein